VLQTIFTGDDAFEEPKPAATWQLNFAQPASDYLKFRSTVERQNVGLENVVLKNDLCKITGTVKVKNIAFDKQVCFRVFCFNCIYHMLFAGVHQIYG
jgi:hypothetical protein